MAKLIRFTTHTCRYWSQRFRRDMHVMDRTCPKCYHIFESPYMLKRHQNNKNPCIQNRVTYSCKHCRKAYISKYYVRKHISICPCRDSKGSQEFSSWAPKVTQ